MTDIGRQAATKPGWKALKQWGDNVVRIERFAKGVANEVWSVRINGHLAVARLGARSDADLAWETELLQYLDREGLTVPLPIPTTDGRLFVGGLVVMTYVEGTPPESEADWLRVADTLRQLHRLTKGWPQRPGWRSSTDLLHVDTGMKGFSPRNLWRMKDLYSSCRDSEKLTTLSSEISWSHNVVLLSKCQDPLEKNFI